MWNGSSINPNVFFFLIENSRFDNRSWMRVQYVLSLMKIDCKWNWCYENVFVVYTGGKLKNDEALWKNWTFQVASWDHQTSKYHRIYIMITRWPSQGSIWTTSRVRNKPTSFITKVDKPLTIKTEYTPPQQHALQLGCEASIQQWDFSRKTSVHFQKAHEPVSVTILPRNFQISSQCEVSILHAI